ncbi:MAG: homoaconitate hydratase [Acidobacteria bacterium]|nr:homoaconitate hydratase [Acidobacteriota bacterium]
MPVNQLADKIWVSDLNQPVRAAFPHSQVVHFYDTTLRDGEQTVGVVLDPVQKFQIASKLDELGVSRIEAGFPRVSPEDAEAFELIIKAGLKAEIWGFSRAVKGDVDELIRLRAHATVIEVPTSSIKLKAYGVSQSEAIRRLTEAVKHAKEHGIKVASFAVDGTRTEPAFLKEVYQASIAAGADEVVVVDTIGACTPEAVEFLVKSMREWVGPRIPIHFHGHNDFGLATASAVAAVRAGATWIHGTINGMGERAGNADIGEIAMALRCLYGVPVELNLTKIRETSQFVQKVAGYQVDAWKPVVGENLFMRESGAVAMQFHIPEAIEPFSAELVGATRSIVLGKKSGISSIEIKAEQLGLVIPEGQRLQVLAEVKRRATEKRGLLSDLEFKEIVQQLAPS